MRTSDLTRLGMAIALVIVQGCAQAPVEPAPEQEQQPVEAAPEITLNLPAETDCVCDAVGEDGSEADYTFLEKGYAALAVADYAEAQSYFERYRRLESSAVADWEADIALALMLTLPESPVYDPKEARKRFRDLNEQDWRAMALHQQTLLARQSLDGFLVMSRRVRELRESNEALKEDLQKREEAIKRLRELTLGQTGAAQ